MCSSPAFARGEPRSFAAAVQRSEGGRTMRSILNRLALIGAAAAILGGSAQAQKQDQEGVEIAKQGYFYVNGAYDNAAAPTVMAGHMYVEYQIPARLRKGAYP